MANKPIYLDYNATTSVDPGVLKKMEPYFSKDFGNPASSNHIFGKIAKQAINRARSLLSNGIGCSPDEIYFSSGATESLNTAITAGWYSTIVRLDDGTIKAWGRNNNGQLGQGNKTTIGDNADEMGDNLSPIDLSSSSDVTLE